MTIFRRMVSMKQANGTPRDTIAEDSNKKMKVSIFWGTLQLFHDYGTCECFFINN